MDRVQAAKARLDDLSREIDALGPPCAQCRYYSWVCEHPAIASVRIDPVTGSAKVSAGSAEEARSEAGLCGPEAGLYEPRGLVGTLIVAALSTTAGRVSFGVTGALGIAYLFG